jgi:hypothetical protein
MACENCTWSKANHTNVIARSLTCGNFTPKIVAERNARAIDPDRCVTCGEFYTPKATKGATKCKCDVPKPPRWVLAEANDKPLPAMVRYGN